MEWGTIAEEMSSASKIMVHKTGNPQEVHSLADKSEQTMRTKTPIEELNRVLGGGLVSGSAILIGGDPGIGKSTLLLQLSTSLSKSDMGCLYITGEESIRLNCAQNALILRIIKQDCLLQLMLKI